MALVDQVTIDGNSPVHSRELLYRNIKRDYWKPRNGGFHLSTQAFTDPEYRISVYRAALCGEDPSHAQEDKEKDYVRSLITGDVRNIDSVIKGPPEAPIKHYSVDVAPAPKRDDPSHAEIYTHPTIPKDRIFKRLQARLVCISQWEEKFAPPDTER